MLNTLWASKIRVTTQNAEAGVECAKDFFLFCDGNKNKSGRTAVNCDHFAMHPL